MRRLRSLFAGLPADSSLARAMAVTPPEPVPAPKQPKKLDVAALRQWGGEVITVPRSSS